MTRCDHDFHYIKKQGDKYLYRCCNCPEERLLPHAEEGLPKRKINKENNEEVTCIECGEVFHKIDTAEGPEGKIYCLEHAWFLKSFEK